jgi:putative ABC transport system substrate-binding protein
MKRRAFTASLAAALTARSIVSSAQVPARMHRIGLLSGGAPVTDASPNGVGIIRGLAQRGYLAGRNVAFERRAAEGRLDRLPGLVTELVAARVDVIVAVGYPAALACRNSPTPVSAVAYAAGDPIRTGLVESMARPGGNVTGISDVAAELAPRRLALLKEAVPTLRRVAMLWNAADLAMELRYQASAATAQTLGVVVQALGVREPEDFAGAFAAMAREPPDAILMVADGLTVLNRRRVFEFAAAQRLPAIYELAELVRDGGLMSYGPDTGESLDRVAALVDRVLSGSRPADLPFERPTRFPLVINLTAARSIGLTLPPMLIALANEVIE